MRPARPRRSLVQPSLALVTGSSCGIGAAIADALADSGHAVAITYAANRVAADAGRPGGREPRAHSGPRQQRRHRQPAPLSDTSDEVFDAHYAVNVRTPFQLARAATAHMGDGGRVINIGSIWGQSVPMPGIGAYAMSKFALTGLTRAWARDLAGQGITVNCVHPDPADGPFSDFNTPRTALGRYSRAAELARAVAWLASPESSYVTGTELNVDGGYSA